MDGFNQLEQEIATSSNENEMEYFQFHKNRYRRFDQFLDKFEVGIKNDSPIRVLEIGSHYLHTSVLLASRGFQVDAMDVGEFWNLEFVKNRGATFHLNPVIENDLSQMSKFEKVEDEYDLVVFTEILEHITFNPIQFWKTIYTILKIGGVIYISTPNSLALPNYIRNLKNMLLFRSIGITVRDILSKVTYGHHWKEYTSTEIRYYFEMLSDDFDVEINPYRYKDYELKSPFLAFKILSKIGNMTKIFSDDLEVIVSIRGKTGWKLDSPDY
jgi:2-polyprenyl-6-hydroxyphenyl methylase/3-demethylubiquinone-9 3-methyltransferase